MAFIEYEGQTMTLTTLRDWADNSNRTPVLRKRADGANFDARVATKNIRSE
jgi:hypothetical protein